MGVLSSGCLGIARREGRRSAFAVHSNIVCSNLFTNIICFV